MKTAKILIVEDEAVTRQTLTSIFEAEGHRVFEASEGSEMLTLLSKETVDLIIMDINLPGKNGLSLARELREKADVALIFLTGRDNEIDKILGLEIGADDYITKPFNHRELTIRTRNLLQRAQASKPIENKASSRSIKSYTFEGWYLDGHRRTLEYQKNEEFIQYKLPRSEFRVLEFFCMHPGRLISRTDLLMHMSGRILKQNDRTVDVTIRRIRKHFEAVPEIPDLIHTIHGEGYRFCGTVAEAQDSDELKY